MTQDYIRIEKDLETKLEQIEHKLQNTGDGFDSPESITELGTFSWHMQNQETHRAIIEHLMDLRETLEKSLKKLRDGAYGICEDCGTKIEKERLQIMPTADLCLACL